MLITSISFESAYSSVQNLITASLAQKTSNLRRTTSQARFRARVSIRPYTLRHAYALRLLSRSVPADLAARLMGHSLAVHQQTYQRWIEADRIQKAMRDHPL